MHSRAPCDGGHLFVYGTLKRTHRHPQHQHLERFACFLDVGTTAGLLYQIDWYPGLVPTDDPDARVQGEIYRMNDPVALLRRLDAFESIDPKHPDRGEYRRVVRSVHCAKHGILWCQLYLYQQSLDRATLLPSGCF